jgi:Zn-finger nucleic acid-binding protein
MPKFRFLCPSCNVDVERYASPKAEILECPTCKGQMKRQFPGAGSQVVREVVDNFTNVRTAPDEKEQNKARKTEYFWEVEVPRLIQTHSLETCLKEGWLVYNDKGELVVNKSPSKR